MLIICTVFLSISTSYAVKKSASRQSKKMMIQERSLYGEDSERMYALRRQHRKTRGIFFMICLSNVFFIPLICVLIKLIVVGSSDLKLEVAAKGFTFLYLALSPFMYIISLNLLKDAVVSSMKSLLLKWACGHNEPARNSDKVASLKA